ncbi:hypothetical protein AAGT10_14900 (plasmid) [Sulfolobus tengchongensis]|uniref:Uncharacterized protein n=1 Tax=Sulfolobus tengchongensis TaxID=207809 RepID=A0AAX4L509_9CREN
MSELIEVPDVVELIRNDMMPRELYAPDGTLLMSDDDYIAETPLVKNRKVWKLYPNIEIYEFDPDKEIVIYRRLSDGAFVKVTDVYVANVIGHVRRNPGITVETAIAMELNAIENETGEITDEREFAATLTALYYALAYAIIYDLVRLQK